MGGIVAAGAGTTRAWAQGPRAKIKPGGRDVLLVVDVQSDLIVPLVNQLAAAFEHVILTEDWHIPGHISFTSAHPGKKPFETTTLPYGGRRQDHDRAAAAASTPAARWPRRGTR